jgi:hypothetical protein
MYTNQNMRCDVPGRQGLPAAVAEPAAGRAVRLIAPAPRPRKSLFYPWRPARSRMGGVRIWRVLKHTPVQQEDEDNTRSNGEGVC